MLMLPSLTMLIIFIADWLFVIVTNLSLVIALVKH